MKDGTFEAYGSRDYEYIDEAWAKEPVQAEVQNNYDKEIAQLKQDVSQLKEALKNIMDLMTTKSNHPLY